MKIGRWLFVGLPLVVMGGVWVWFGWEPGLDDRSAGLFGFLGVVYVLIGLALLRASEKRWVRGVAILAWLPLLRLVPIGTVLGIVAMRLLWTSRGEREAFVKVMNALSPAEAARILKEQAMSRFGIKEEQVGVSLVGELRFAPGEVNGFLDDLEEDYGFALADEVNASTASVKDMLDALARVRG
jgi:hypothetical protein